MIYIHMYFKRLRAILETLITTGYGTFSIGLFIDFTKKSYGDGGGRALRFHSIFY